MSKHGVAPVFLLASERSGTNLLRKLITQHQSVYFGPSPAHFLKHLFYAAPYYGDLQNDVPFKELVADAVSLCKVHFSPWLMDMDVDEIVQAYDAEVGERDVILLSDFLLRRYAAAQGFAGYFCKDNDLHEYVGDILGKLPNAKFIYLHRDPRDFAVSQMSRTLQSNNLYAIAKLWHRQQVKCISTVARMSDKVFRISYEELISDEVSVIRSVCAFLGVDYSETASAVHIQSGSAKEWKNLAAPVMKGNSEKYKAFFSARQVALIEDVCWHQMRWLGYPVTGTRRHTSRLRIASEFFFGDMLPFIKSKLFRSVDSQDAWAVERGRVLKRIRSRVE